MQNKPLELVFWSSAQNSGVGGISAKLVTWLKIGFVKMGSSYIFAEHHSHDRAENVCYDDSALRSNVSCIAKSFAGLGYYCQSDHQAKHN